MPAVELPDGRARNPFRAIATPSGMVITDFGIVIASNADD
jgi:hypothetical protein